jgi:hypothetical protein
MIEQKRSELERFIREQLLGPGGMGERYIQIGGGDGELLSAVPAGIYSTGILFPVDDTQRGMMGISGSTEDNDDGAEAEVEEEEVFVDTQSLNQMYPNSIGLTICLDRKIEKDNDLEIWISGRYYRKLDLKEAGVRVGILLEQDRKVFDAFIAQLPAGDPLRTSVRVGVTEEGKDYLYLASMNMPLGELKERTYAIKKEQGEAMAAARAVKVQSVEKLKEKLFDDLRLRVLVGSPEGQQIVQDLQKIEELENSIDHLLDVLAIHDSSDYGLWKGEAFEHRVGQGLDIPVEFKGKQSFLCKDIDVLDNIHWRDCGDGNHAALGVNLQYSKHEREEHRMDRLYLKVQLLNRSSHYADQDTGGGKNYFSVASEVVNRRCYFGVKIQVKSRHLAPYHEVDIQEKDSYGEDDVSRYIYRQFEDYGQGHGCSVVWGEEGGLHYVATEYIPTQETPDVDPVPPVLANAEFLQFKWLSTLSETSDQELLKGLKGFVGEYARWTELQQDTDHPKISKQMREACQGDQVRMEKNIELLQNDGECLLCFRLMNTAMFMQLWHGVKVKRKDMNGMLNDAGFTGFFEDFYREKADDELFGRGQKAAWRPFQLAFILLNLDGTFQGPDDVEWTARNEWVDLVWFPTGGGKTEAYLGLIALTIIQRRRKYKEMGGGTAVMMRYTLRLLTMQQFQRATLLIMALELIRRWRTYLLGEEPIYIGLFVGQGSLPNKLKGEKDSLEKEYDNLKKGLRSKIPLRQCPWCGHPLDPVVVYDGPSKEVFKAGRILLDCSRPGERCAFSSGHPFPARRGDQGPIPVSLCDEEIYQQPPALLFGTVDKFAQIAHKVSASSEKRNADARRLFGYSKCNWEQPGKPKGGYLPPDLIIQDELHLIMGPLGSAVALFESAIDQLCTRELDNGKKVRPKVISSTATTRNTTLQIMALFNRRVNLFPKPGVNCDDSFFAYYKRRTGNAGDKSIYVSKRKYMGILPTGRTQMWMQLRLAAILFTHRAVFEKEQLESGYPFDQGAYPQGLRQAMDYYHTVLAYYNSLREVGKTESQVYSYLIKEIRRVFNKVLRPGKLMHCLYTFESTFDTGELTGRLSGDAVVSEMERIGTPWDPTDRVAHGNPLKSGKTPPDLVIATNMISVGIDISRFNTMIMNCMPRNIAEYIQATSRVARDQQGLVITVHHPFRSRDISHYERFIEFHEKMYSYVEPISITPFTRKALERYLPLYIATMVRHRMGYINSKDANQPLSEAEAQRLVEELWTYFKERMERLQGMDGIEPMVRRLLTAENLMNIDQLARQAVAEWQLEYENAIRGGATLVFNNPAPNRPQQPLYVDIDEYQDNIRAELWQIPQSLRVVEPEAVIHVKQK